MSRTLRPFLLGLLIAAAFFIYTTRRSSGPQFLSGHVALTEAAPQGEFEPEELNNIRIYRKVRPSVVNITSQIIQFDLLFGAIPQSGQGSGFFINQNGYILTNNHVIQDARRLQVTWTPEKNQSTPYRASIVGAIPDLDLAVIKINATNLPEVTLGDSTNLQVGQKVLAIGNPFGLPGTLTRGIISSIRTVRDPRAGVNIDNAIQTDAPINPGNSGGPLLNSAGQVIGINTLIYSETGANVGIGFAIPINVAKAVLNDLITTGHVRRPTLGIVGLPVNGDLAAELGLPVSEGLLVIEVQPDSAAARAGIRGGNIPGYIGNTPVKFGGDIIADIDGQPITDASDLGHVMVLKHAGDTVTITIYRGRRKLQLKATLGESARV